ncbi:MAG: hypothetical protein ACOX50_00570 [Patescibacteria group bacterium]|jgi:uncharacterized iron-regulated membrane protein
MDKKANSATPVSRAGLILSILFLLFLLVLAPTVYLAFATGVVDSKFVKPLQSYWNELNRKPTPTPTPTVTPSPTAKPAIRPTAKPTLVPKQTAPQTSQSQPSSCTRYKIYEGEFASDKCYSKQDYQDLWYYLGRFNDAVLTYNGAQGAIKVTCNGHSEMFKQTCEEKKKEAEAAQNDINRYREIINGIIARGK